MIRTIEMLALTFATGFTFGVFVGMWEYLESIR